MTFEDILSKFQLNPNEIFRIDGHTTTYCFRPTGEGKEVKLFDMSTYKEAPASIAFELMQNPSSVLKGRLFSSLEAQYAGLILDVSLDVELSVKNENGVYKLSDGRVLGVQFPNIKDGESFLITYIVDNVNRGD